MKKLLLLLPLLVLFGKPVEAQQIVLECIVTSLTPCNSVTNPGNGSQGTPIWQAGGDINTMLGQVYGMFGNVGTWKTTGVLSYLDILNILAPGGPNDGAHCPATNHTVVACGGTPAGSSGNFQYNNGGVFGAYTAAQAIGQLNSGTCNAQTGTTYTTVIGDANACVTDSNAAAVTNTVPPNASVAYIIGTILTLQNIGANIVTVSPGSGVTFQGAVYGSSTSQGYQLNSAYSSIQLQKIATDTWNVNYWFDPVLQGGSGGTKFTTSGTCTNSATAGDATKGTVTMSSAGNCTIIVTINGAVGATAKTGWVGTMADRTQPTIPAWRETASSATTITFTVPTAVASSDVVSFGRLDWY